MEDAWTCAAALLACTYMVRHEDLPTTRHRKTTLRLLLSQLYRIVCVLFPEWHCAVSIWKYIRLIVLYGESGLKPGINSCCWPFKPSSAAIENYWTFVHLRLADMGFIVITSSAPHDDGLTKADTSIQEPRRDTAAMESGLDSPVRLDASALIFAIKSGSISKHPPMDKDDLLRVSRSDAWAMALSALSAARLFALLTRQIHSSTLTPATLGTSGVVLLSAVAFVAAWSKPRHVRSDMILSTEPSRMRAIQDHLRLAPDQNSNGRPESSFIGILTCLLGMALGGVCMAGCNIDFPTLPEQWLWRVAAITTVVCPALCGLTCTITWYFEELTAIPWRTWLPSRTDKGSIITMVLVLLKLVIWVVVLLFVAVLALGLLALSIVGALLIPIYVASRLVLVAEMIRSSVIRS